MAFIDWLSSIVTSPVEGIVQWFNDLGIALGSFFTNAFQSLLGGTSLFIIDGITCVVLVYGIYCTYRIMFTTKDDQFSEYTNKTLIACVCYYVARYVGAYALHTIGA